MSCVADMSVITPTTFLCFMEMGVQCSSTCLHYRLSSQLACWEKPCKSSSSCCQRRLEKTELQAWLTGNLTMVLQAKGKQLRPRSLREIKCLRPVRKVQLCSEKLLKTASKTIYREGKNSELAQRSHQELFYCLKKEEHSKAFLSQGIN